MKYSIQGIRSRVFATAPKKLAFYVIAHGMYAMLAGGFEIALILRLSGSFERIVFVNLFTYVLLYGFFVAGTLMLRSGKASRNFRIDLLVQACASAYMLINFSRLANPLVLAGFFVMRGISEGLFWTTRHSALIHSIHDTRRDSWSLKLQSVTIVLNIVLPVLSGFVISFAILPSWIGNTVLPGGYYPVYALTGALAFLALLVSPNYMIPEQKVHFRRVVELRKDRSNVDWVLYTISTGLVGIVIALSVGIINFYVLKTEFNMGIFASWIALASAAFFALIRHLSVRKNLPRIRMVGIGIGGEFLSRLVYYGFFNLGALIFKSLLDSFIVPLRSLFGDNIVRRRIESVSAKHGLSIAEGLLFQESVLLVSRVATCVFLIVLLAVFEADPVSSARALLLAFMGFSFVDFLLLRTIGRRTPEN